MKESNNNQRTKTVYCKTTVYFRKEIKYSSDDELQDKIDDLETCLCLDLDNIGSDGGCDYECDYEGLVDIDKDDIPNWVFRNDH